MVEAASARVTLVTRAIQLIPSTHGVHGRRPLPLNRSVFKTATHNKRTLPEQSPKLYAPITQIFVPNKHKKLSKEDRLINRESHAPRHGFVGDS